MAGQDKFEALVTSVINCGFQLHRDIGPGLLETVYEILLAESIRDAGFCVERQVVVPIKYKGVVLDHAFKADLLVERHLLVELKSTERNSAVYGKQVLTYLRLLDLPVGILMNFGQATFKEGLQRIVNGYADPPNRRDTFAS